MPESKLVAVLKDLCGRDIRFVVVGGLAAILDGASVQTYDIDLVYSREPENIQRLLDFLRDADAIFRIQPHRRLRPNESHLAGGGHLTLLTRYGPVDLLGTIGNNLGYADLLPHSNEMDIGEGLRILVLDLETIIAVKEQLGSAKDLAALPALYQTLRQMKKSG
jgi:predicted nucleotidyltransferase